MEKELAKIKIFNRVKEALAAEEDSSYETITELIDSTLTHINFISGYRIDLIQSYKKKRGSIYGEEGRKYLRAPKMYSYSDFPQAEFTAILDDEIYLSRNLKTERHFLICKLINARNTNVNFIERLSEMIFGDDKIFIHRNVFQLVNFFKDIGINYNNYHYANHEENLKVFLTSSNTEFIYEKCLPRLFQRGDFFDLSIKVKKNIEVCIQKGKEKFKEFVEESLLWDCGIDFSDVMNLNINIELLFNKPTKTFDAIFNKLIDSAKSYFIKGDKQIAVEKLWDAFERLKTHFDENKKFSSDKIVEIISDEIEKDFFEKEFLALRHIGNSYHIRHFEKNRKPIKNNRTQEYLFYRLLALLDLISARISIEKDFF